MKRLEEDFKKIEEIDEQLGQKLQECSECVTRNPECFDPLEERTLKIVKNFVSAVNTSIRNYREFEKSEHKRANDSLDLTPKRRNGITKW